MTFGSAKYRSILLQNKSIPLCARPALFVNKYKAVLGNLALAFCSLLVVSLVLEAVSSLFLPPPIIWREPQEQYQHDPLLGHALVPGQHAFTHSHPVAINSYGFRDREHLVTPEFGTFRILCIGDSLTFGDGVAIEDTYPKQLETVLNESGTGKFEVINAGVPSYDTWQEVMFFRIKGVRFEPRIVILGFYGNDIVPRPEVVKPLLSSDRTLSRKGMGKVLPDRVVHLLKGSRILLFLKDRVAKLVNLVQPSSEYLHQRALLEGQPDRFVERGWQEVESSLQEMAKLQESHRFRFIIVSFPMAEQLVHAYPESQYPAKLKMIAESLNISYVDLYPAFKREFKGFGSLFIEWDGHPNQRAYRIAAETLAEALLPLTQDKPTRQ